jgi:MFS family permease
MTSEKKSQHQVLNPTVLKLGLVSFFADVSSEILYPITPIFLTTVLGASMFSVGLIEGLAEGLASLLKVYSGQWSDSLKKRKLFIVTGYFLAAISKPLIGVSLSWGQVLFARSLDRFGKGIRTSPRDAMLADSVSAEKRGAAFGVHRGMDTLGAALGPLLALLFLARNQDLREIYNWALLPGIAAVFIALTLKEKKSSAEHSAHRLKIKWSELNPQFKKYLWAWGLFSLANSSDVFLLLKAQQSGNNLTTTILMYAFYNLLYSLCSPYLGHLSDRWGRKIYNSVSNIGGGGKIICTEYYRLGWLPKNILDADLEYQRRHTPVETIKNYLAWAQYVVPVIRKNRLARYAYWPIARSWAYQMAYRMKVVKNPPLFGFLFETVFLFVSNKLGSYIRKRRKKMAAMGVA